MNSSDVQKWVKAQSDQLEKAVRDRSLDRYVGTGSPLFAAVFCYETETPLKNVQLPTPLLKRIDEEVDRLRETVLRARSLPRVSVMEKLEKASWRAKRHVAASEAKTEYRSIMECTTVHEAGTYLSAFKNMYFELQTAKQDPEFIIILELETCIWRYWMIYDACLNLAKKSATSVTGSNVLDKFITALYSFKRRVSSIDGRTRFKSIELSPIATALRPSGKNLIFSKSITSRAFQSSKGSKITLLSWFGKLFGTNESKADQPLQVCQRRQFISNIQT